MHDQRFPKYILVEICPFQEITPKQDFHASFVPDFTPKQDILDYTFGGIEEFEK